MSTRGLTLVSARSSSARTNLSIFGLGCIFCLASGALLGAGSAPVLAQSGEIPDVILLDDVPGFVGAGDADTVIACRPDQTCVTDGGNVLAGFRPALWPNLRRVGDDPVIEEDVQVVATAFGRVLLREGTNAESFASAPGQVVDSSVAGSVPAVAITPHPAWELNNFQGSGAVWISYANTGEGAGATSPDIGTTMTVTEAFTVPDGTTGRLEGFVLADDTAQVVLVQDDVPVSPPIFAFNDATDGACADGPIGCEPGEAGDLSLGDATWQSSPPLPLDALQPGDYALEITARQDGGGPFGLQYAFAVSFDPPTVADVCWTFDGGAPGEPGEKVCVSIAECGDCVSLPAQCPTAGEGKITLTSGAAGEEICTEIAEQFFEKGATTSVEEFQFVVGFDVPETAQPRSVRVATCIVPGEGDITYVPFCRNPPSSVLDATVHNDLPISAVETPRCVTLGGKTYC